MIDSLFTTSFGAGEKETNKGIENNWQTSMKIQRQVYSRRRLNSGGTKENREAERERP